ncbi:TetR/AcrR family transcriptional regulator [Agrococcus casei]|uniref:Glutamate synthase [NADPH] large chain n=2 Tax=Agrococcus TaxID=46352 RepID=A0A1R4GCU2_9MICO|nr:TetR/AcrR family transcriptional regulator [Agrococcus casei]SJM66024.1 Glutamate synthase [NADPH] large chain [Agrococcus casei LMG 22410]
MSTRMRSADRRRLLAQATRDIILTEGEKAATVRAITGRAGMPLSSFHYVYESREEAVREVWPLLRADDSFFAVPELPEGTTMEDVIIGMVTSWFRGTAAEPLKELGELELFVHSIRTEELRALPAEFQSTYEELVIGALENAMEQLGVTALIPMRSLARMVLIVTDGASKGMLVNADAIQPDELIPPLFSGFNRFFAAVDPA